MLLDRSGSRMGEERVLYPHRVPPDVPNESADRVTGALSLQSSSVLYFL